MLPIVAADGQLLLAPSLDNRPPPREFSEFFNVLVGVSAQLLQSGSLDTEQQRRVLERARLAHVLADTAKEAQVFDFGEVGEHFLMGEAKLGGKLMAQQLLQTPYQSVLYWYTLTDLKEPVGEALKSFQSDIKQIRYGTLVRQYEDGYLVADFMAVDADLERALREIVEREPNGTADRALHNARRLFLCSGIGFVSPTDDGRWTGYLLDRVASEESAASIGLPMLDQRVMGSLADGMASLTMVLATKGVRTHVELAPVKLNIKREKLGKSPYPMVTCVDARSYEQAVQRTALGGTHASPVPHLRRGHIRTYQDGRKTWIRSALVNCRSLSEISERDHYEVRV